MSSNAVIQNPHAWCYKKMLHGKHVNALHLNSMTQRYYAQKEQRLIRRIFDLNGKVALSASQLTRRMRQKYKDNRFIEGKNIYYVFDKAYMPADIGCVVIQIGEKEKHEIDADREDRASRDEE